MLKIDYHGTTQGHKNSEVLGYYWSYTVESYAESELSKNRDRRREMLETYIESQKLCSTDICDMAERVVKLNNRLEFPYGYDELYQKLDALCNEKYYENNYASTFDETVIIHYFGINKHMYDVMCYQFLTDADIKIKNSDNPSPYDDILIAMGFDPEHGYQDQVYQDEKGEWHRLDLSGVMLKYANNIPKAEE